MKGFSERNPIVIAVVCLVVLATIGVGTFYLSDLPVIGNGTTYSADFADAAGLKSGDDVRVAGVKVGTVKSISLAGDHVHVQFQAKNVWLGDASTASIRIKTLLGQEYIQIVPLGQNALRPSTAIPVSRTTTPLDVSAALNQLGSTVGSIDTTQLAKSFDALSAAFQNTPDSVRSALQGLSSLSRTISSRDAQLTTLARNTDQLTSSLAQSNQQFSALINDGGLLLQELQARSASITQLLQGTRDLSQQLSGLVTDNRATLGPALAQLTKVTDILVANQGRLDAALKLIGPYYTLLTDATGSGPWLDIYICGLFDRTGAPVLDSTAQRNCVPPAGVSK